MVFENIKKNLKDKIYYEEPNIIIINDDCLNAIKELPDKSIDFVVTDPPYGINIIGGSKSFGSIGGSNIVNVNKYMPIENDDIKIDFTGIFRISKNQIIFGGNYFNFPISKGWIVWDKKCKNNWNDNFSDGELIWTSLNKPLRIFRHLYMGLMKQSKDEINRVHPTQKPLQLMKYILLNYTKETDTILDPFLGSGTTTRACKDLGRKCIGIEINQSYCDIAVKRLGQEVFNFEQNLVKV